MISWRRVTKADPTLPRYGTDFMTLQIAPSWLCRGLREINQAENGQSTIGNRQFLWCPRRDSNPEPTDYESAALTVELQGRTSGWKSGSDSSGNVSGGQKQTKSDSVLKIK